MKLFARSTKMGFRLFRVAERPVAVKVVVCLLRLVMVATVVGAVFSPVAGHAQAAPDNARPQASATAYREAEAFFHDNGVEKYSPITRQALATFLDARKLFRAKEYRKCLTLLEALWAEHPIGSDDWHQANMVLPPVNLGGPHCYTSLLILTDACKWRLDPASADAHPHNLVFGILLFGHSRGPYPRTKAELAAGTGPIVTHNLQPEILANDHKLVRDSLWLFEEYIEAITRGGLKLDLEFIDLPNVTVPVGMVTTGPAPVAAPPWSAWPPLWPEVMKHTTRQPEWWWTIYPSNVPDEYPDFAKSEFISGGNAFAPDGKSLRLEIDDKWLIRRPPHLGKGAMTPIEIDTYLPMWLQHEFFHHVFGKYPGLELEKIGHQWHHKENWPKDFVGVFEPDYFYEAVHKRLLTGNVQPLALRLRYDHPSPAVIRQLNVQSLLGRYSVKPPQNPWHTGELTLIGKDEDGLPLLQWTNSAHVSWLLSLRWDSLSLLTGRDSPYASNPDPSARAFSLELARDANGNFVPKIASFSFLNASYEKQ